MIATLIFNSIAVFLAWLESNNSYKHGLKLSIFIMFIFLALRYDFGNDYMAYLELFQDINRYSGFNPDSFIFKGNEIGWLYLNRFFGFLGFFPMIAFLAAFTCFVLYLFIKTYVPLRYYWFAVFIYVFQPYNMLVLSSAMRQAVVVSIFLLAIDLIIRKKIIWYILLVLIGTLFHTSAIFLLPFILLAFLNWKINIYYVLLIGVLFSVPFIFINDTINYINFIASQYLNFYLGYIEESEIITSVGLGFALNVLIYLIVIFYSQKEIDFANNILFKIAIISFLMIPLSFGVQLIGRLNFYLLPVMMAVFPLVFLKIKKSYLRILFVNIVVLFTLYNFFIFFESDVWKNDFGVYYTIFSAPELY